MKKHAFLEPIKVGPIELKNRIILPAMAKYFCGPDGFMTDDYIAYFENIAAGGAAKLYCQVGGRHCEADWEKQLGIFMPFLWQE